MKKIKREREIDERGGNESDNDKSDSELVVDDLHNENNGNMNNGNGTGPLSHNGISSRSPHENGNSNNGTGMNGGNELMQNNRLKKEENSRSPHSDNSSRSTPSAKRQILVRVIHLDQIHKPVVYLRQPIKQLPPRPLQLLQQPFKAIRTTCNYRQIWPVMNRS